MRASSAPLKANLHYGALCRSRSARQDWDEPAATLCLGIRKYPRHQRLTINVPSSRGDSSPDVEDPRLGLKPWRHIFSTIYRAVHGF